MEAEEGENFQYRNIPTSLEHRPAAGRQAQGRRFIHRSVLHAVRSNGTFRKEKAHIGGIMEVQLGRGSDSCPQFRRAGFQEKEESDRQVLEDRRIEAAGEGGAQGDIQS